MGGLHLNDLFARGTIQKFDSGGCLTEAFCLTRPPGPCGTCDDDSYCAMVGRSCNECAANACLPKDLDKDNVIKNGNAGNAVGGDDGGKSNIGPIVGGVIGGLAVLGIIAFLLYRRWSKKKEREMAMEDEKDAQFGRLREARVCSLPIKVTCRMMVMLTCICRLLHILSLQWLPAFPMSFRSHTYLA